MGVELCVITKGAAGGVYSQAGDPWIPFSSHPVTHVIDACGAGDAFLGGLLVGLYRQLPVEETIFLASTCGALAVTQQGSWPLPIL
jgi:sugar/nucleoside kinase (ribokinase family)